MNASSKTLFIDTATRFVYLALLEDGNEIDSVYHEGANDHSVTILPLLDAMLKRKGLVLHDLEAVVVGIGPGSYTGVRIGVSIAKMIGYLNGVAVRTVSSLALLASGARQGLVVPFVDARRGNAFMGAYRIREDGIDQIVPDVLENVDVFLAGVPEHPEIRTEGKPDASIVLRSGLLTSVDDIHALVPNYLQVTEAENRKAGR
jgi:tRNA threonylcarbamoyladenosine biosynthesis protein TsaB